MHRFALWLAFFAVGQAVAGGMSTPTAPVPTPATTLKAGQIWEGVYFCGAQQYGARLWVKTAGAGALENTLEFYPLFTIQNWPYGRVNVASTWQGDVFTVQRTEWEVQPRGFDIPKTVKVQMIYAGPVLLMSFSREEAERTGCTSARFDLLGTLK